MIEEKTRLTNYRKASSALSKRIPHIEPENRRYVARNIVELLGPAQGRGRSGRDPTGDGVSGAALE